MLKYIAHTDLKDIQQGECSSICIYDETGKLVAFVAPFGNSRYIASTITDKDFDNWVKILRLDKLHVES
jgi:hemolysin-activating ACP:hemolysin acyltransferase